MVVSGDLSRPPDDDDLCLVFHPKTFPDSIYTLQYVSTPPRKARFITKNSQIFCFNSTNLFFYV